MKKTKYSINTYRKNEEIKHNYKGKRNYSAGDVSIEPISPLDPLIEKIIEEHMKKMKDNRIIRLETKVIEYV